MVDILVIRKRLEDELAKIEDAIVRVEASARTVTLDQSSVGRLSRMDALQQQAMAQDIRQRMLLQRIKLKAALGRIDLDAFGLCCECGVTIEQGRLERDPAAVFCADCMSEREDDRSR